MIIEIWTKNNCPQCVEAKNFISLKAPDDMDVMIIKNIDEDYTKEQLLDAVPSARSVPQIFIDNKYIGGLLELKKLWS